jgi:hypothetical protein
MLRRHTGMDKNTGIPPVEDYGSSDVDDVHDVGQESDAGGRTAFDQAPDANAGGTAGTTQGSGDGEQFGEFNDSGIGTDLTREMDSTKTDVDADLNR